MRRILDLEVCEKSQIQSYPTVWVSFHVKILSGNISKTQQKKNLLNRLT